MGLFQLTAMIFKNIEILKVRKINLDFLVHRQDEVWMKLSTRRLPNLKCFILILLKSFMKFEIPNPVFPKVRSADHFWSARIIYLVREKKNNTYFQPINY
jgi:hypothetical protein